MLVHYDTGLGIDCPAGYFEEAGQCLVQTQQLANTGGPPTQYYPGIYGPPTISPVGLANPGGQLLSPAVAAAIRAAGHSVDCKQVKNCAGSVCVDVQMCSLDGGPYEHGAYALNANPGVALVSLGAKTPLFPATAPPPIPARSRTSVPAGSSAPAVPTGGHAAHVPAAGQAHGPVTPVANQQPATDPDGTPTFTSSAGSTGVRDFLEREAFAGFPWWQVLAAGVGGYLLLSGRRQ